MNTRLHRLTIHMCAFKYATFVKIRELCWSFPTTNSKSAGGDFGNIKKQYGNYLKRLENIVAVFFIIRLLQMYQNASISGKGLNLH